MISHSFCVSGIQKWLNSWWFWLRVFHEVIDKMLIMVQSSEGLTGTGGSTSQVAVMCWQVGADWWDTPAPFHVGLSIDCLRSSWLQESKPETVMPFMTEPQRPLAISHFCNILLVSKVRPIHCGRGSYKSVIHIDRDHWGPLWSLATISNSSILMVMMA